MKHTLNLHYQIAPSTDLETVHAIDNNFVRKNSQIKKMNTTNLLGWLRSRFRTRQQVLDQLDAHSSNANIDDEPITDQSCDESGLVIEPTA